MQSRMELGRKLSLRPAGRTGCRCWLRSGSVVAMLSLPAVFAVAQKVSNSIEPPPGVRNDRIFAPTPINQPPDANSLMAMRNQEGKGKNYAAVNAERRKQISEDSARLLKLAQELMAEVEKASKDTLSLNVVRKAEAIEKLAHSVREKMKLTVGER